MGGAGTAVLEALQAMSLRVPVLGLGFDDVFTAHGDPGVLMKQLGLTALGIRAAIEVRWPGLAPDMPSTLVPFKRVG